MRMKIVEIQRDSEERENELINEINILVNNINKSQAPEDGAEEMSEQENREAIRQYRLIDPEL